MFKEFGLVDQLIQTDRTSSLNGGTKVWRDFESFSDASALNINQYDGQSHQQINIIFEPDLVIVNGIEINIEPWILLPQKEKSNKKMLKKSTIPYVELPTRKLMRQ